MAYLKLGWSFEVLNCVTIQLFCIISELSHITHLCLNCFSFCFLHPRECGNQSQYRRSTFSSYQGHHKASTLISQYSPFRLDLEVCMLWEVTGPILLCLPRAWSHTLHCAKAWLLPQASPFRIYVIFNWHLYLTLQMLLLVVKSM